MAALRLTLLPEDLIRAILAFAVESDWLHCSIDLTCKQLRMICCEQRFRLNYPQGRVVLAACSRKLQLLEQWFSSGLRELAIRVRTEEDIVSMQSKLLQSGKSLAGSFPSLKSLTLSCPADPALPIAHQYNLDGLGDVPQGSVLAVERVPLPESIPAGFEAVEMREIYDPNNFNLRSLKTSSVKSFSILPVTRMVRFKMPILDYKQTDSNGMTVEHLLLLPDCIERLALNHSHHFDCWNQSTPVPWPQSLTELDLCSMRWKPGSTSLSLPTGLKKLVVRDGLSGVEAFDLSWLTNAHAGLEHLEVAKIPFLHMGPFPLQLKYLSMFADAEFVEAPEEPPLEDPEEIRAAAARLRQDGEMGMAGKLLIRLTRQAT